MISSFTSDSASRRMPSAPALEDCQVAFPDFLLAVDADSTAQHEKRGGVAVRQGKFGGADGVQADVPKVDGREGSDRTSNSPELTGDHSHGARLIREPDVGDLRAEQRLITRFSLLLFRPKIDPELHHLQGAPLPGELTGMEFLVDDAVAGRHPLNVARADPAAAAAGIAMLEFALVSDGHRFEAFVGMGAHAALLVTWGKPMRRRVIQQQKRAQLAPETIVVEYGPHRETVAHPMHG